MTRQPTPFDRAFGRRLKFFRELRGYTQDALATRLGLSYQQVQKYESGISRMTPETVIETAHILDIGVLTLLGIEGDPIPWVLRPDTLRLAEAINDLPGDELAYLLHRLVTSIGATCHRHGQAN